MKKISLLLCSAVIICSCGDNPVQVNSIAISKNFNNATPEPLRCTKEQQWVAFDVAGNNSKKQYIQKASFDKGGHFTITFIENNIEGYAGGGYEVIEGSARFTRADNGNNAVTLYPQKGIRKINNGNTRPLVIGNAELKAKFANTYLWEKICFPKSPSDNFLILAKEGANNRADKSTAVKLRLY